MNIKTTLVVFIAIMALFITPAIAADNYFTGDEITDGILREMKAVDMTKEQIYWNDVPVSLDMAKLIYLTTHQDASTERDIWVHVGHSNVHYKDAPKTSSSSNDLPNFYIQDNDRAFVYEVFRGDNDIVIRNNIRTGIILEKYGNGDIVFESNTGVGAFVNSYGETENVFKDGNIRSFIYVVDKSD